MRVPDSRFVLGAALVVGLVVRAAILWHTPSLGTQIVDEQHYTVLARNVLAGDGFGWAPGSLTSFRPPLYPATLAAIWSVAGVNNLQAIRLFQIVLALLTTALVYQLGRRLFTPSVGRYAAAATFVYPSIIFFNFTILTETLYIFLLTAFILSAVMMIEKPRPGVALLCGAVLGLSCLTRSVLWPLPIVLCPLLVIILRAPLRTRLLIPALVFAGYAVVITPWAVRNTRLQGVLTVVDTQGALNLYMGNYARTPDVRMWDAVEQTGEIDLAYALNTERPGHGFTEGQKAEWAQKQALAYIAAHPTTTLRRAGIKFADFWGLERELAAGFVQRAYAPPRWFAIAAPFVIVVIYIGVALTGVAGLWLVRAHDWRADVVVLLPVVAITAAHTIVFGHSRYHIPLIPILAVYGAALARDLVARMASLRGETRARALQRGLQIAGAVASVGLLLFVWGRQVVFIDAARIRSFLNHVN